jgi:hypothetical protein
MPQQTEEERESLRVATYHTAQALADDLQHIRTILDKTNPTPGDVRRMSAWLRRILVYGDITKVAPPRTGRVRFDAPDLRWNQKVRWIFYAENATEAFAISTGTLGLTEARKMSAAGEERPLPTVKLSLDTFLAQRVLSLEGAWANRGDAIKFIANKAHGAHSTDPQTPVEQMLATMRHLLVVTVDGENTKTDFTLSLPGYPSSLFKVGKLAIDCVQMNMVSTARILVNSKDVKTLEQYIAAES